MVNFVIHGLLQSIVHCFTDMFLNPVLEEILEEIQNVANDTAMYVHIKMTQIDIDSVGVHMCMTIVLRRHSNHQSSTGTRSRGCGRAMLMGMWPDFQFQLPLGIAVELYQEQRDEEVFELSFFIENYTIYYLYNLLASRKLGHAAYPPHSG